MIKNTVWRKAAVLMVLMAIVTLFASCSSDGADRMMLYNAGSEDNAQGVIDIIERDSSLVNEELEEGMTPLMWAAWNNNEELCRYLIEKGAEVTGMELGEGENLDIVKLLVSKGADVGYEDADSMTLLEKVLAGITMYNKSEYDDMVAYLQKNSAEFSYDTFLLVMESAENCLVTQEMLKTLEESGEELKLPDALKAAILGDDDYLEELVEVEDDSVYTAIYAAAFCSLSCIKHLESIGYDFSKADELGPNGIACIAATYNSSIEVAEYLKKKCGETSLRSEDGRKGSIYSYAAAGGNFEAADSAEKNYVEAWNLCSRGVPGTMQYLMESGYEPDEKEILDAFAIGNRQCIECLIKDEKHVNILKKASASVQGEAVYNALEWSQEAAEKLIRSGVRLDRDCVDMLVKCGKVNLLDEILKKPEEDMLSFVLGAAIRYGNIDMAQYAIDKGADINGRMQDSEMEVDYFYPVHLAAGCPSESIIRFLIESGADQNKKDADGLKAMEWAKEEGYIRNIKILKECN